MSSNKSIMSNMLWKLGERFLAQVISLIVSIVLARLLMPEEYGTIALVLVFINIANVFVISGFSTGLIQKKDADDMDFSTIFYFNLVVSVILYLILVIVSGPISEFYANPELRLILRVLGIRIIVSALNSIQHSYVARKMMFRKYFWATLFGTLVSGLVGIILAYKNAGVWALVAQYLTNTIIDSIVLWFTVKWRPKLLFSFDRLRTLVSYSWKILFEELSATISNQIRNLFIGKVYSSNDLAYYSKGQQFPSIIVVNISSAISSVLFPAMANIQSDSQELKKIMRQSIKITSFIVFPMLLGLGLISKPLILLLLTDKWLNSVPFLQLFCLSFALQVGLYPRHQALKATGRSDVFMYEHQIGRLISFAFLLLLYKRSVWILALTGLLGTIVLVIITMFTSKRYSNYKYREQVSDVFHSLVCCIFMGVIVFLVGLIKVPIFVTLLLQVLAGIVSYFSFAYLFRFEELFYLFSFFKKNK